MIRKKQIHANLGSHGFSTFDTAEIAGTERDSNCCTLTDEEPEAQRILAKYPKLPDEDDPFVFPRLSNQKFNEHLKEEGKRAGMIGDWITEKQVWREKIRTIAPI